MGKSVRLFIASGVASVLMGAACAHPDRGFRDPATLAAADHYEACQSLRSTGYERELQVFKQFVQIDRGSLAALHRLSALAALFQVSGAYNRESFLREALKTRHYVIMHSKLGAFSQMIFSQCVVVRDARHAGAIVDLGAYAGLRADAYAQSEKLCGPRDSALAAEWANDESGISSADVDISAWISAKNANSTLKLLGLCESHQPKPSRRGGSTSRHQNVEGAIENLHACLLGFETVFTDYRQDGQGPDKTADLTACLEGYIQGRVSVDTDGGLSLNEEPKGVEKTKKNLP